MIKKAILVGCFMLTTYTPCRANYIDIVSDAYNIDSRLVRAIITVESNWKPESVSTKGARGLMQIMPNTAADMGILDIDDPYLNIHAGVKYLRYLTDRFGKDNITLILSGYNAGPTITGKFNRVPNYPETVKYIEKVLNIYRPILTPTPPKKQLPEIIDVKTRVASTKRNIVEVKQKRNPLITKQLRGCSCLGRQNRECTFRKVWSWKRISGNK